MDFNKIDLINETLIIQNEDGTTTFVPRERCEIDTNVKALFEEFETAYPNGKTVEISLDEIKNLKIQEISNECNRRIVYEFYSDCLGNKDADDKVIKDHFDCDPSTDQPNIQGLAQKAGLVLQNYPTDGVLQWKRTGEPICYTFEPTQCIKLGLDMYDHVALNRRKFEAIRRYILDSATDKDATDLVNFDIDVPTQYYEVPVVEPVVKTSRHTKRK